MDFIPYVSINPTRISFYSRPESHPPSCKGGSPRSLNNLSDNDTYGIISKKASYRIKTAIDWMIYLAKPKGHFSTKHGKHFTFKLTFVTLTLASKQIHSDNEIKEKLLNHFLVVARQKWHVNRYLWRAESQKNGNIHFHVLTDKFIPWDELRLIWNRIQNKLGYVDRYAKEQRNFHQGGFRFRPELSYVWSYYKQKKAYKKGLEEGWNNPNSTDIHSIKRIGNLSAYLSKYCAKNDYDQKKVRDPKQLTLELLENENTPVSKQELRQLLSSRVIEGKLWRLSQSLSKLKSAIDLCDSVIEYEFTKIRNRFPSSIGYYPYNTNVYLPVKVWSKFVDGLLYNIFLNYVKEIPPD